jgi:hypothetical protein
MVLDRRTTSQCTRFSEHNSGAGTHVVVVVVWTAWSVTVVVVVGTVSVCVTTAVVCVEVVVGGCRRPVRSCRSTSSSRSLMAGSNMPRARARGCFTSLLQGGGRPGVHSGSTVLTVPVTVLDTDTLVRTKVRVTVVVIGLLKRR